MLIQGPLSILMLDHDQLEQLPVIVVDTLDECSSLRYDLFGRDDFEELLCTLKYWTLIGHLRKSKLIITSQPEDCITQNFLESISTCINILSSHNVKSGDSTLNNIKLFLISHPRNMNMEKKWVNEACRYLVPHTASMFIWAITVADFLQTNPKQCFNILQTREQECSTDRFENLYSVYTIVIKILFEHLKEEEIKAVTLVLGVIIFAK